MSLKEVVLGIWRMLNEPFSILLIGSGVGFLFVKLVWEPFKVREADALRRRAVRDEVEVRLFSIDRNIDRFPASWNVDGGDLAESLDPAYKTWSLSGLIFAGWGQKAHQACLSGIDHLKLSETERHDRQKIQAAQNALSAMRQTLGLPSNTPLQPTAEKRGG